VSPLQRTPLYEHHLQLGARLVPFAGFEMPVQYGSILDEHRAVRERAGLFDVSHMGQLHIQGETALETAERLLTCPVASLRPGRVRYGLLLNEAGGVVDDVTVYRLAPDAVFLCVNAANIDKDRDWIESHALAGARVSDRSSETGLLALQGPRSADVLPGLCDADPTQLRRFRFVETKLAGSAVLISRTGYTGSDGFEIYAAASETPAVWEALVEVGRGVGLEPAGLGARDTLRLEAALALYGHELDDETSPLEARLEHFVKPDGFIGAEALERLRSRGPERLLVGFELDERGVARAGHEIRFEGDAVGKVTSGGPSPTLGRSIGLGYVPPALAEPASCFEIDVRGRGLAAHVVPTPFVRRGEGPRGGVRPRDAAGT
jgi:aminomethyltransferase